MNIEMKNEAAITVEEVVAEEMTVQEQESVAGGMLACNKPNSLLPAV